MSNKPHPSIIFSSILWFVLVLSSLWYADSSIVSPLKNYIESFSSRQIVPINVVKAITTEDHIRGELDADVFVIEYSDPFCPACFLMRDNIRKEFIKRNNQRSGSVSWVYRHLPLSTHLPSSYEPAVAAECVAKEIGNESFWRYIDTLFSLEREGGGITREGILRASVMEGGDSGNIEKCIVSGEFNDKVLSQRLEAFSAGAIGTPFIVLTNKVGEVEIIRGGVIGQKVFSGIIDSLIL